MKYILSKTFPLFFLILTWYLPVKSAEPDEKGGFFEMTPVMGLAGSSPLFGIRGAMVYPIMELQMSLDLISGQYTNLYPLSIVGVLPLGGNKRVIPFGSLGGGMSITIPQTTLGGQNITEGHVIMGGGLKYYLNNFFGFRFEVGQILTRVTNQKTGRELLLFYQQITLGTSISFGRRI